MKKEKEMNLKELAENLFAEAQHKFPHDPAEALSFLLHVAEFHPDFPNIDRYIGFTLLCQGEMELATNFLTSVLDENPNDPVAAGHLITALCTRTQYDEAEIVAERFVKMCPYDSHFHYLHAETLRLKGLGDLAEEAYNTALDYNPKHMGVLLNLAFVYCEEQEYEEAEKLYKRALRVKPYCLLAAQNLAVMYFNWRKFKSMQRISRRITKIRFHTGDLPPINTKVF